MKQSGDRTEGYSGKDNVGKIVSNDGVNASYLRDEDGTVELDDQADDPYKPPPWKRH